LAELLVTKSQSTLAKYHYLFTCLRIWVKYRLFGLCFWQTMWLLLGRSRI